MRRSQVMTDDQVELERDLERGYEREPIRRRARPGLFELEARMRAANIGRAGVLNNPVNLGRGPDGGAR